MTDPGGERDDQLELGSWTRLGAGRENGHGVCTVDGEGGRREETHLDCVGDSVSSARGESIPIPREQELIRDGNERAA